MSASAFEREIGAKLDGGLVVRLNKSFLGEDLFLVLSV
jgi:hypothetical protein